MNKATDKKPVPFGVAQGAGVVLVSADHPENILAQTDTRENCDQMVLTEAQAEAKSAFESFRAFNPEAIARVLASPLGLRFAPKKEAAK